MATPSALVADLKWTYRAWRYRLKVEKQEIRCLLDHLGAGETAVDVGAHKGAYTYWMRRRVGPGGAVFAFEPQPGLADKLAALVAHRGFDNVVVENIGLSLAPGTLMLRLPRAGGSPSASFERTADTAGAPLAIPVAVTTMDAYFLGTSRTGARPVRFIKCDAEGHELEVFRGAEQLLDEHRPDLLFECEARHHAGGSVEAVFEHLQSRGYRGWFVGRSGLGDIAAFDPSVHQADPGSKGYVNNFFFSHPAAGGG